LLWTSSCEATKKALQARVDAGKDSTRNWRNIPVASSESIQERADTSSASSSSSTDLAASDSASESSDTSSDSGQTNTNQENNSTGSTDADNSAGAADITGQRQLFSVGIKKFEEGDYLAAEYYFNKIKDTYKVLSDHINYYLAKSLLMQEKYDLSAENYSRIKNIYPDSIFLKRLTWNSLTYFTYSKNIPKLKQTTKAS